MKHEYKTDGSIRSLPVQRLHVAEWLDKTLPRYYNIGTRKALATAVIESRTGTIDLWRASMRWSINQDGTHTITVEIHEEPS